MLATIRRTTTVILNPKVVRVVEGMGGSSHGACCCRRAFSSELPPASFRPRRRPHKDYRPVKIPRPVVPGPRDPLTYDPEGREPIDLGEYLDGRDELERDFGPIIADGLRDAMRRKRLGRDVTVEEYLQMADYMTAEPGSLEEKMGERRGMALDAWDETDRKQFLEALDEALEEVKLKDLALDDDYDDDKADSIQQDDKVKSASEMQEEEDDDDDEEEEGDIELDEDGDPLDPNCMVHGPWAEMVVRTDRVQKVQRGGTMLRYKALVIGGNANGCAGFGIGKAATPPEALKLASRQCRRNIFFVDRHMGTSLTTDLAGRHNSCKVILRAVNRNFGLHGHPLVCDILLYFGITDCTAKTFGNRNQYNVVYATFKALLTHESLEQIAWKRGKRLMNLARSNRLQI